MLAHDERQSGMDIPLEPGRKVRLSSRLVGFDSLLLGERESPQRCWTHSNLECQLVVLDGLEPPNDRASDERRPLSLDG